MNKALKEEIMNTWKSYTGEEILFNALDENGNIGGESMLEDSIKQGILISSYGECQLLKFYYTDGFGWYFKNNKITFILHECKVTDVGTTLRGYVTCIKKALLQNVGYYFKIKHKQYTKFSKKLILLAKEFGYIDVAQFIIDNFGMFLITSPKFICNIDMSNNIKQLINLLEQPIKNCEVSPSKYWDIPELREIIEKNLNFLDIPFCAMPDNVNLANTGEILNRILSNENNN